MKSITRGFPLFTVAVWLALVSAAIAQYGVPREALQCTLPIRVGDKSGTAFLINYLGKMYIVTARHVVAGVPESKAIIQTKRSNKWVDVSTVKTLFPASKDVDIAVFETNEKVAQPFQQIESTGLKGVAIGQQIWFLGYPYGLGLGSHYEDESKNPYLGNEAPFVKSGTMSAVDTTNPDAVVMYIDGFNNPGFSGGPIVCWNFSKQAYTVIGIVSGYKLDAAKTLINGQPIDTQILVNSGILVGYNIDYAIQAIKQSKAQQP